MFNAVSCPARQSAGDAAAGVAGAALPHPTARHHLPKAARYHLHHLHLPGSERGPRPGAIARLAARPHGALAGGATAATETQADGFRALGARALLRAPGSTAAEVMVMLLALSAQKTAVILMSIVSHTLKSLFSAVLLLRLGTQQACSKEKCQLTLDFSVAKSFIIIV